MLLTGPMTLCDLTVLNNLQLWHHFSANLEALLRYNFVKKKKDPGSLSAEHVDSKCDRCILQKRVALQYRQDVVKGFSLAGTARRRLLSAELSERP